MPSRQVNDILAPDEARRGAESLAAAAMLCRQLSFVLPDDPIDPEIAAAALDPRGVLPDWPSLRVDALLSRSLFDPAAFGRVRFHHRRVLEYLAATWFSKRVDQGCPYRALEESLFRTVHGHQVLAPSRAPIAAWLIAGSDPWHRRLLRRVLAVAPAALVEYGDPRALPIETRRELLTALVSHYRGRERLRINVDSEQLARLADGSLAPDLARLIRDPRWDTICGRLHYESSGLHGSAPQ